MAMFTRTEKKRLHDARLNIDCAQTADDYPERWKMAVGWLDEAAQICEQIAIRIMRDLKK